jgi:glycosyltransferase involved in cell wall biosynthesis
MKNDYNSLTPKVSVIIPTYNRSHFIKDAVESVVKQTYYNFEVIVVDDGSTDNTKELLAEYVNKLNNFKYIYQDNQGRSAARNLGISLAKGDYIAFLDSDDVWFPDKLERQVPILESAPSCVVLVHGYKFMVDKFLQPVPNWEAKLRRLYAMAEQAEENYENYLRSPCIFTSTILVRRAALVEIAGYDIDIQGREDLDLYLRLLLLNYKFSFISEPPLIKYRWHENNTNDYNSNCSYVKVYEKHLEQCVNIGTLSRVKKAKTLIYQALAKTHYRLKNYPECQAYWRKALYKSWFTALTTSFWRQILGSWIRQGILN